MSYLLDTHVFLWLLGEPEKVVNRVRDQLADRGADLVVSAASAWEVATKTRLARFDGEPLVNSWPERAADIGARLIDMETADALLAGSLSWEHRDPFDRMLAAQTVRRNATLVTLDPALSALPGLRTLTW